MFKCSNAQFGDLKEKMRYDVVDDEDELASLYQPITAQLVS